MSQTPDPRARVVERVDPPGHAIFAAVEVEAPIRDSRNVDCWTLGSLYQSAASEAEARGDETAARGFGLLCEIANIHFKPEDRAEPFGPLSVFDGQRTLIPSNLHGEQSAAIAGLVPTINNSGLRARLADLAWQNDRKLASMAQHAIDGYCESVELVLDGKAEFFNDDQMACGYDGCRMLRRACQLAHATGWKDPGASRLRTLIGAVVRDAIERQDHRGFSNASEIALDFAIDDAAAIALNAERFAASEHVDPHWSHDLWELAARAHGSSQDEQERYRCLAGAAESYLAIADAVGGEGMVAASAIMDAILALRRLPNTKQRRKELEGRLRHAQRSVRDEMGVISTTFDLTDFIRHARKSVGGKSLPLALGRFADLAQSPEPEALREQARRIAAENPLSSIMGSTKTETRTASRALSWWGSVIPSQCRNPLFTGRMVKRTRRSRTGSPSRVIWEPTPEARHPAVNDACRRPRVEPRGRRAGPDSGMVRPT